MNSIYIIILIIWRHVLGPQTRCSPLVEQWTKSNSQQRFWRMDGIKWEKKGGWCNEGGGDELFYYLIPLFHTIWLCSAFSSSYCSIFFCTCSISFPLVQWASSFIIFIFRLLTSRLRVADNHLEHHFLILCIVHCCWCWISLDTRYHSSHSTTAICCFLLLPHYNWFWYIYYYYYIFIIIIHN